MGRSDASVEDPAWGCSAYSSHDGDDSVSVCAKAAAEEADRYSEELLLKAVVAVRKAKRARNRERPTFETFLAASMMGRDVVDKSIGTWMTAIKIST